MQNNRRLFFTPRHLHFLPAATRTRAAGSGPPRCREHDNHLLPPPPQPVARFKKKA